MRPTAGLLKQPNAWRGTPGNYSLYAPIPHEAPDVLSALTPLEERIFRWFTSPDVGRRQPNQAWVCGQHSYVRIAIANLCHPTTARRAVHRMREKCALDTREVWANDQKGGRRVGTLYSIPSYQDILTRRRAKDGVAVTPSGAVLYIGRARRLMTLEEAERWSIDLALVPRARAPQPSVTQTRVPRNAPLAEMPATTKHRDPDEAGVLAALLSWCPANTQDARDVLSAARRDGKPAPIEVILSELASIRARKAKLDEKRNERNPVITPKWFIDRISPHLDHWRAQEAALAREREREARVERDARLNQLAKTLRRLQQLGDEDGEVWPDGRSERQNHEDWIRKADRAELDEARALVAQTRTRTA